MKPIDKNILQTLNLLTTLFRAQKQKFPKLPEEEQYTLIVTEEHLAKEGISIFTFLNTLRVLNEKGYLMATCIYENEYHEKVRDAFKEDNYSQALEQLSKINAGKLNDEQKSAIAGEIERILPPGHAFDKEEFDKTDITYKELLDPAKLLLADHKDEEVSVVTLMPFRDIDQLLEQMNNGKSFDDIQDSGVWYDSTNYEFHIGNKMISVEYQGKPNVIHDVLRRIIDNLDSGIVWYEDVTEHKPSSLRRRLNDFIDKDDRLKDIFKAYSDRLQFDVEAF